MENFICNQYGQQLAIINIENITNLWMNNKVRGDKYASCLHFRPHLLNISIKLEFLISQGNVATYLRLGGHCHIGFVANFICFPAVQKF